eukprot:TRINITY_DN44_c0_g1_i1.p1 TRINITY_DN44_c0_g1~~TRINITY_DN44_c0_g1_i1.p1  ORF type:complete len:2356 (-),score=578.79 TRINITY_DN44_c0_g1_i1:76-6915(-)
MAVDLAYLQEHEDDPFENVGASEFVDAPTTRDIGIDSPVIVPWGQAQASGPSGSTYRANRYVIKGLNKDKSTFLMYPYPFNVSVGVTKSFADGAFLDTELPSNLPTPDDYYFYYLQTNTTINLSKAKAVYDSSIAILQVTSVWTEGVPIDLTFESDYFCTAFYSYIWGKYKQCFRGVSAWQDYLAKNPANHESVSVVFVSAEDIKNGALQTADGQNRFGTLFLPDVVSGAHGAIFAALNTTGKANLHAFVNAGGLLYSSGKSALLAELLGFAANGTFDQQYTITGTASALAEGSGCAQADFNSTDPHDFAHRALCFSPTRDNTRVYNALLSGPIVAKMDTNLAVFSYWTTNLISRPLVLHDTITGLNSDLSNSTKYPMVLYKTQGKGHVVLNLGNAPYDSNSFFWAYNAYVLANSKPLVLDNTVVGGVNRVIPALEQVSLQVKLDLKNLFSANISRGVTLYVWYRSGLTVTAPADCKSLIPAVSPPASGLSTANYFNCSLTTLPALSRHLWTFSVSITDNLVTQGKNAVMLLYPQLSFEDETGKHESLAYAVTVDAAMAALLRADMNIDPSSMYPLNARGSYVDNVMNCENKEETQASKVRHVSIVPLISPLIDINDQIKLARQVEFDVSYYHSTTNSIGDYPFPMQHKGDLDYLDFTRLYNRGDMLAASWDEAVKLARKGRDTVPGAGAAGHVTISEIVNANYQTNNEDDYFLLQQTFFNDSDTYYEHATQRMMAFLDTWEPKAAATFNVPIAERSATNPAVSKFKALFARHDVFFWTKYPLPANINNHEVFSLDRYTPTTCRGNGTQSSKAAKPGVFTFSNPAGLVPVQWENELLLDCTRQKKTLADISAMTGAGVTLTHYVIPITDTNVTQAADLAGFTNGALDTYPEVSWITIYQLALAVDPAKSRQGGELVFTFATDLWQGKDPVKFDWVTVAADQVAVIKTWWVSTAKQLHIRFKRGNMPNEAYGNPSYLQINLEGLNETAVNGVAAGSMDLFALVYDISDTANGYERWDKQTITNQAVNFTRTHALSLPALKMVFELSNNNSILQPYEFLEPFVRYGLYEQELMLHRPVHGSAEIHPINEPCLVTANSGFSTFTHVGTSSVPFREYVNTGISLSIPAAAETGRVEWTDLWGRRWSQPVRSTIFEYPPIPPPLRNFVMTTTFEVLNYKGDQLTDWHSDDEVTIHVQMKLLNNYPKWFEATTCKANEVVELCGNNRNCDKSRIFDTDWSPMAFTVASNLTYAKQYIKLGHNATYGSCFGNPEVYLSGRQLSPSERAAAKTASLCAPGKDDANPSCEALNGMPTLSRRPTNNTTPIWNFAQQDLQYWPDNYIKGNMWDLTHYDYDDNKFDKAYKYHMDNNLPHLGHYISKTDNVIAFPIFKGLGYKMVYDSNYAHSNFPNKKGWWSDNLQNRDHTLVSGQTSSNNISVGRSLLFSESRWTDITTLSDAQPEVNNALKNIYTCLFNRKWLSVAPNNDRTHYLTNVYENNVIPLPPTITSDLLYNYKCDGTTQFSPETISSFNNVVLTDTPRDWLYFASNLRGNALENINVLYKLTPLDSTQFEGVTKVQDGGRFVYWNPANSRNSFLVHDNPVSTIFGIRNDLTIGFEVIPTFTTTFNAAVYQHITVKDPAEDHREWTLPIYTKHHGYGDFAVSIYVGGDSGTSILQPGGGARVKYTFSNNAGFDINLLVGAIESSEIESKAINSNDLLFSLTHTLKYPDRYNFMNVQIPSELRPYVTLAPSKSVVGVAPLFFDFDNINVATIRDGWKGDYYYELKLASNFPDDMRGRLYTLPASLNMTYFERFPGAPSDPTGIHSYTVTLPSIVFGVPYASNHRSWPGKVFYTSGYSTKLQFAHELPAGLTPEGAYFVTTDNLDRLRQCLSGTSMYTCLDAAWANISATAPPCAFSKTVGTDGITVNYAAGVASYAPKFPVPRAPKQGPDQAELNILLRTTAAQLTAGYPTISKSVSTTYTDWAAVNKSTSDQTAYTIHAKGAWLSLSYSGLLVTETGLKVSPQTLQPQDGGFISVTISVTNAGDDIAYNVNVSIHVAKDLELQPKSLASAVSYTLTNSSDGNQTLTLILTKQLSPGSLTTVVPVFKFAADTRPGAGAGASSPLNARPMASGAIGQIDLTSSKGERVVQQVLSTSFSVPYTVYTKPVYTALLAAVNRNGWQLTLKASHNASDVAKNLLWRYQAPDTPWSTFHTGLNQTELTFDVNDQWKAIMAANPSSAYAKKRPIITYAVSIIRDSVVTGNPAVLADSNVWQWPTCLRVEGCPW